MGFFNTVPKGKCADCGNVTKSHLGGGLFYCAKCLKKSNRWQKRHSPKSYLKEKFLGEHKDGGP